MLALSAIFCSFIDNSSTKRGVKLNLRLLGITRSNMRGIHRTKSGFVEVLRQYGHGRSEMICDETYDAEHLITVDDGDGHYIEWGFEGERNHALYVLAELYELDNATICFPFYGGLILEWSAKRRGLIVRQPKKVS